MFLLGEYYEDEAREIADRLKDVGMKVDIRMVTTSYLDVEHFLEGRMSEMKGILEEEDYARYERYLAVLRKVISEGAGPEDLPDRIEMEMDPQIDEKRNQLAEAFFSDEDLTEEEQQAKEESLSGIKKDVLDVYKAISFIDLLIDRNDIAVEDDIASKLEDPIIRVIDDNYDEEESDLARMTISFSLEPKALVFVDELSSLLAEKLDEDLAMALTNDISGFVQSDDMNKLQRFFMYLQEVMRNKASKNMELNPLVSMIGRVIEEIKKIGM